MQRKKKKGTWNRQLPGPLKLPILGVFLYIATQAPPRLLLATALTIK